jgi:hypothetical protein
LLLILFLTALAAAQPAKISGRVVNQSGDPVRDARVRLIGTETLTGISGDNGIFAIDEVPPGAYALVAWLEGFAAQKYGAATVLSEDCDPLGESPTQEQRRCMPERRALRSR